MRTVVVAAIGVLVSGGMASASDKSADKRFTSAAEVVQEMRNNIPDDVIDKAQCIAVIPGLKKAAFLVGGEHGSGVMSCRTADGWSAPVFLDLTKGSFGLQAGVSEVDLILLVMNERGADKLLSNKVTLGADASVAAGPVGRQAAAGTDISLTAEILSYSRAKGVFAGIDLSGGSLGPDGKENRRVYGSGAEPKTIIASRPPAEAAPFIAALPAPTAANAAPAAPSTMASAAPSEPSAPSRVEQAPQYADRGAAGVGAPTGTTGVVSSERSHRRPRMPQTASPLAFNELISGLALVGAAGIRRLRRRIG